VNPLPVIDTVFASTNAETMLLPVMLTAAVGAKTVPP
jgi:hypothetical protein